MSTVADILNELKISFDNHNPIEPGNKDLLKLEALRYLRDNKDSQAIVNLTESHSLGLRWKAIYRHSQKQSALNKNLLSFKCYSPTNESLESLLECIKDMPKEWTIIQMTSQYNPKKYLNKYTERKYTDPIHLTVFNCGQATIKPFLKTTIKPEMELAEQLFTLTKSYTSVLKNGLGKKETMEMYREKKCSLEYGLKEIITLMEYKWLAEWRCLLVGKFCDAEVEEEIHKKIEGIFVANKIELGPEMHIVQKIASGVSQLKIEEIKVIISSIIKDSKVNKLICKALLEIRTEYLENKHLKRHPVILLLDESLDHFPWEMMDVLRAKPVCRMPSLHLTYALFKEHEKSIKNGMKQIQNCKDGKFIVNPGKDLAEMEKRINSFLKYYLPSWEGISGQKPTSEQFTELLLSCQIFIYNGHGSGVQYIGYTNIEKLKIPAVVLLFGCASIGLQSPGPNLEPFSSSYEYLIASSPCIVGMLWDVSDFSTDMLTAKFLTTWIKSPKKGLVDWNQVDYSKWERKGEIEESTRKSSTVRKQTHEPELLRALSQCRDKDFKVNYFVKAACVARGIPVYLSE